jgi:hypothetical protein
MRGIVVLVLLLMVGGAQALAQAPAPDISPHHGNSASSGAGDGHALSSGETLLGEEATGAIGQCGSGLGGAACRVAAFFFGSVERGLVTFTALLALSTLVLWFYTRRVALAARAAADHVPAVERAYVFGGPTDLFLLHDQATVRLAMQNYGKTPAVIREWLVEFTTEEPKGREPAYNGSDRTVTNEILEPFKLFSPATVYRSDIPAPFYIVGYIVYDDVFRRSHTTRFCVGIARDGKAAFAGHPEWNAYD